MFLKGFVPYKPNESPKGTAHQQLSQEYKRLYHFVRGGNDGLKPLRRESMFIQLLEGLHEDEDPALLVKVKDKIRLEDLYKINLNIIKEKLPPILSGDGGSEFD